MRKVGRLEHPSGTGASFKTNTVFVFELKGEVTEGLVTAAGSNEMRKWAFRSAGTGTFQNEHGLCVQIER